MLYLNCHILYILRYVIPQKEFYHKNTNFGHHKEYLAAELIDLLKWSHFENISYNYVEDTLKRAGIVKSIGDIKTRNRHVGQEQYVTKFDASNYMEYVRVMASIITAVFPHLRSSIICQSQNPLS